MSRRFTIVSVALTAVVAFLVGAIFAGGLDHASVAAGAPPRPEPIARTAAAPPPVGPAGTLPVNFADVVERVNATVVNIDATARGTETRRRRPGGDTPDFGSPFDFNNPRDRQTRRGAGSGFIRHPRRRDRRTRRHQLRSSSANRGRRRGPAP